MALVVELVAVVIRVANIYRGLSFVRDFIQSSHQPREIGSNSRRENGGTHIFGKVTASCHNCRLQSQGSGCLVSQREPESLLWLLCIKSSHLGLERVALLKGRGCHLLTYLLSHR